MQFENVKLINLLDLKSKIILDIRYATSNNFVGIPLYKNALCYLHQDAAYALNQVQCRLETQGLGLKAFDGYRPISVQQKMWDLIQDERYVANPANGQGRHPRGTAIDLTLVDNQGIELTMPTPFDDFTEKARSDYADLPEIVLQHRKLLKEVMGWFGFVQDVWEWWHFDLKGWEDSQKYPSLDIPI